MPASRKIEQIRYDQGFRLENGKPWEIYCLVDTHNQPVTRTKELAVKDTHGQIMYLPWGTIVYPLVD